MTADLITTALRHFPLIPRARPPALPLDARIESLAALAAAGTTDPRERAVSAAAVMNQAALLASDVGMPQLASDLCWRHYNVYQRARPLPPWAIELALQPLLNIPRQMIRNGDGTGAHNLLIRLLNGARERTTVILDGTAVNPSAIANDPDQHKTVRTLLWAALLADGTRALTTAGRWREASNLAISVRGVGRRLLDGRQITILALLLEGQIDQANSMLDITVISTPWERAVQSVLQMACGAPRDFTPVLALWDAPGPSLAVFRTRVGLAAIDFTNEVGDASFHRLQAHLLNDAAADGYAARDLLAHPSFESAGYFDSYTRLHELVISAGLTSGTVPEPALTKLMASIDTAERTLVQALTAHC